MIHMLDDQSNEAWANVCAAISEDSEKQIKFYLEKLEEHPGSILELGCATGRITEGLVAAGADVHAIDPSIEMIKIANRRLGKSHDIGKVTITQATLLGYKPRSDDAFGIAIVPHSGFMSLLTPSDQQQFLKKVRGNLSPKGCLIVDIQSPHQKILSGDPGVLHHVRDVEGGSGDWARLFLYSQREFDNYEQVGQVKVVADYFNKDGVLAMKVSQDIQVRYTHRWEMNHLLTLCGFEVIGVYGDFCGGPYTSESLNMVWVACPIS